MRNATRAGTLAALSVLLMLAVVAASAKIRAAGGVEVQAERAVHRVAASSVALLVLALSAFAWRVPRLRGMSVVTCALMLALSAVGWMAGTTPSPPAAFFNQFAGLALTALLAWVWARASWTGGFPGERPLALLAAVFCGTQAAFGAALAAFVPAPPVVVLVAHAGCGLAAATLVAATRHPAAIACAAFAVGAGALASLPKAALLAPVAHALSAALVFAAAAAAHGRAHG